jgi:hypothetical protein
MTAGLSICQTGSVLVTSFRGGINERERRVPACRGRVRGFSDRSASRMARYLRCCEADYRTMLTLTYPGSSDGWHRCKAHLRSFSERLKRAIAARNRTVGHDDGRGAFSAFWFLEFQKRGAPHFHIFTTHDFDKEFIARCWYEIVGSNDERHLAAGTRVERIRSGRNGTIAYARKYAAKREQKTLPTMFESAGIGRFFGVFGSREIVEAATILTLEGKKSSEVIQRFNLLEETVAKGIKRGQIRRFRQQWCTVYLIGDGNLEKEVRTLIYDLSNAIKDAALSVPPEQDEKTGLHGEGCRQDHLLRD